MDFAPQTGERVAPPQNTHWRDLALPLAALLLVLLVGAYFRFTGLMWGDYEYQHPDERFLVWVVADIAPVESLDEYFDTARSSLNPANRGHEFYVYGDLPVIATRYLTEAMFDVVGWEQVLQAGRGLSAFLDLLTVLLVFRITERLFGWRVGTLAGLFTAAAVLQIQQSHFFTVDTFATLFTTLAVYLAVLLVSEPGEASPGRLAGLSLSFGAAVGLAMASKLNAVPVAALLPVALLLRWLRLPAGDRARALVRFALLAAAGGLAAFLTFRVTQPYAFSGPGFFDLAPDDMWLRSIRDLSAQSAGDVDFPPALQWARRPLWFSLQNLVLFGLGLPLGVLAWAGFFLYLARLISKLRAGRGAELLENHWAGGLLVWGWTAAYFTWQSLAWNPTMRYQLPIYPTLAVLAAWGLGYAWRHPWRGRQLTRRWQVQVGVAGALVLLLTLAWAFAFTRIYTRTETRVAASQWIYENVPGPVNLTLEASGETRRQLVPLQEQALVQPGAPYLTLFDAAQAGAPDALLLSQVQVSAGGAPGSLRLRASIRPVGDPAGIVAQGEAALRSGSFDTLEIPLSGLDSLTPGQRYSLALELAPGQADAAGEFNALVELRGQVRVRVYGRAQQAGYDGSRGGFSSLALPEDGTLRRLHLEEGDGPNPLMVVITDPLTGEQKVASAAAAVATPDEEAPAAPAGPKTLQVEPPLSLKAGVNYLVALASQDPGHKLDPGRPVRLDFLDEPASQLLPAPSLVGRPGSPMWLQFSPRRTGLLREVTLARVAQVDPSAGPGRLRLAINDPLNPARLLVETWVEGDLAPGADPRGSSQTFRIDPPVEVREGEVYTLRLEPETGAVAVRGYAPANESTWDMGLPFRLEGYDPFGGIYQRDLNFEMYWEDNEEKLQRFLNILDQADYIFISSNRQWGTTTRLPERHPLTTTYYRELLGCPEERDIIWCYNVAEEGTFEGRLGFELVRVFTSYPNLGPLEVNTQFAEEAFTVYDHPKVFIFQKRPDYDPAQVRTVLGDVDLEHVVHISPKRAAGFKNMLLPSWMWRVQQAGGTWARLFPPEGLHNRYPAVGLVVWYLAISLLGLLVYPLIRLALPGLPDRGYPLARIAGLVLLAYPAWLAGSLGAPVTRGTLALVAGGLAALGLLAALLQRKALAQEWRERRGYFLRVELVALAFFAIQLLIRLGNPDLWHPIFGGEKPMNFSQFNAVLKSTLFPPYDPWFAGGSMNYYYYGYVLVGMPVKLLGITPSVAYNLILPSLFSMVALAAFSIGWNLYEGLKGEERIFQQDLTQQKNALPHSSPSLSPFFAGLIAAVALLLLGNLGTVRMYWEGVQRLVVPEEQMRQGDLFDHWVWAAQGVGRLVTGQARDLPYYLGDWYWKPSRAIQPEAGNEITEFPFFTFLYADLHAHLMALPVTLLVIAWSLSAARMGKRRVPAPVASLAPALLLGALAAGALRPANTWDQYTYLALAAVALAYGQWMAPPVENRALRAVLSAAALAGLALLLYQPFDRWFGQAYNALEQWEGVKTGLGSYLVHWGLFLFAITTWMIAETVDWMASTPVSALNRLRPACGPLLALLGIAAVGLGYLLFRGVWIALVAVPLGLWAAALLFRPGQPVVKRAVLFMTGTALALTLAVELVAVRGDIARMNTVFKFYYQAWSLFSLCAAAAVAWLWGRAPVWGSGWRRAWQVGLALLVAGAVLYPLTATQAKIADRMTREAPHTLDGMAYMAYTHYTDGPDENLREMDLAQDLRAIRWMQHNVEGSPVIVEANTPEYRHWGTRYTIYTGLPAVVGWNWHERQQRALTPDTWVFDRIADVHAFYRTTSQAQAAEFLDKYDVGYVVLGQLERIFYEGPGLEKFAALEGVLWERVYQDGETEIYRVIRPGR